jgi:hypothetical protein
MYFSLAIIKEFPDLGSVLWCTFGFFSKAGNEKFLLSSVRPFVRLKTTEPRLWNRFLLVSLRAVCLIHFNGHCTSTLKFEWTYRIYRMSSLADFDIRILHCKFNSLLRPIICEDINIIWGILLSIHLIELLLWASGYVCSRYLPFHSSLHNPRHETHISSAIPQWSIWHSLSYFIVEKGDLLIYVVLVE